MSQNTEVIQHIVTEEIYSIRGKVIVLLPVPWSEVNPAEIELLSKILSAVNLKIDEVQLVASKKVDLNSLLLFSPTAILSFGSEIKQVNKAYDILDWNGVSVIKADSLSSLEDGKKKILWNALRQMFSIG